MADDRIDETVTDLLLANRILDGEGVLDAFGHVSARMPGNPERFLLSRSRSPGLIERSDLLAFDLNANVVKGEGRPYLESVIHAAIYRARPDVNCVIHHHAPAVLPFCISDARLVPVFHLGAVAGAQVPLWDSQDEFGDTNLLVADLPMAASLARALGNGPAVLLRRHGAVVASSNIRQAVFVAICMRDNAELILRTRALTGEPDRLTPGEIEAAAAKHDGGAPVDRAWEYWVARNKLSAS